MKKNFFTLVLSVWMTSAVWSQNIFAIDTLVQGQGPSTTISPLYTYIVNNSGNLLSTLSWKRTIDYRPGAWESAVCIGALCYNEDVSQGDFIDTVDALDSSLITGYFYPDNMVNGLAFMEVVIYDRMDSANRSEERRVGKECRSRWSAYH